MRRAVHWAHAVQLGREASNQIKANRAAGMRTKVDGTKKFTLANQAKNRDFEIHQFIFRAVFLLFAFVSEQWFFKILEFKIDSNATRTTLGPPSTARL